MNKDNLLIIGALASLLKDFRLDDRIDSLMPNESLDKYDKLLEEYAENTTKEEREQHLIDLFIEYYKRL